MTYQVNQRVLTPKYGPGTIIGFECFDASGKTTEPVLVSPVGCTARVIVELDSRDEFLHHQHGHPHFQRAELMLEPILP